MKKILCFGDSNTYGFIPANGGRYETRWPTVLQNLSQDIFEIIEAGCNNRTGFVNNPAGKKQTGCKILPSLLNPSLDCVILAIGINDLQIFFRPSYDDIKNGMQNLIDLVQKYSPNAKIVVAAPSLLTEDVLYSGFAFQFDKVSIEKSKRLAEIYKNLSEKNGCLFINLEEIAKVSSLDGLHYEPEAHEKIGQALFELLSRNL